MPFIIVQPDSGNKAAPVTYVAAPAYAAPATYEAPVIYAAFPQVSEIIQLIYAAQMTYTAPVTNASPAPVTGKRDRNIQPGKRLSASSQLAQRLQGPTLHFQ